MIVIIINRSKKKAFRSSKRKISELFQPITNRVSIGDVPKRILIQFILGMKLSVTKGTSVQVFFESKNIGYRGFKCIQIGKRRLHFENFEFAESLIDKELILNKIITNKIKDP